MVLNSKVKNNIPPYPSIKIEDILRSIILDFKNNNNNNLNLIYSSENLITYSRSTYSIYKIFKFLNKIYNKKNIFIPDYICNESLELLRESNANIIFYDHTKLNTNELLVQMSNNNAGIIMIINYFGEVKKLESFFIKSIKESNTYIIEDNTHCIKASQTNYSDFEIYSPHKLFGIADGSIIKFNNVELYDEFQKNFCWTNKSYIKKNLNQYPFLLKYLFKRILRRTIGYEYPKLNFEFISSSKKNIREVANPLSIRLLGLYYLRLERYIKIRIKNYYIWKKNLELILPFIEMDRLNYIPYLGIIKFKNTKQISEILKQYNNYGLPIGNWPDLPKEVIKSKSIFREAKEKFRNQLTIPLHQDIEHTQIINCVKNSFIKYIKSFNTEYSRKSSKIKIYDKKKLIGRIIILHNSISNQNLLRLEFNQKFYNIYQNSKSFFYKFSIETIYQLKIKEDIHIPDEFIGISNYSQFKFNNVKDNIIPLLINEQKIKNYIYSFLKIIYFTKEINSKKINDYELIFEEEKGSKNDLKVKIVNKSICILSSINYLQKFDDHFILKKLHIIDKTVDICDHLIILCIHLRKQKLNYLKINKNYKIK